MQEIAARAMLATGSIDANGMFALTFDRSLLPTDSLLLLEYVPVEGVTYRGLVSFVGGEFTPAAISPNSEAAVRLIVPRNLDVFSLNQVDLVNELVDSANESLDFATLSPGRAAQVATENAGSDPRVREALAVATATPPVGFNDSCSSTPSAGNGSILLLVPALFLLWLEAAAKHTHPQRPSSRSDA